MMNIVLVFHIVICVFLVILVLLQQGKGADVGAAFGGGSNTLFGATGANNLMVKVTTFTAFCFMVTSILLIRGYAGAVESVLDGGEPRKIDIRDPLLDDGIDTGTTAPAEARVVPEAQKAAPAAPQAAAEQPAK